MELLKPYIKYIEKNSEARDLDAYIKSIDELNEVFMETESYIGIKDKTLLEGVKSILKNDLNTLATTFIATSLSFTYTKLEDIAYIEKHYSAEIGRIVEGIQKIRSLDFNKALEQPDMQRKLVLSVARDTRSLLILLAANLYLLRNDNQLIDFKQKSHILFIQLATKIS